MNGESNKETRITTCKIESLESLLCGSGNSNRALNQPRGAGWGKRREGCSDGRGDTCTCG